MSLARQLGIPWGNVRVIKPYIGGGFGNKQDVLYEPLNAFLTTQVGGRPVRLDVSREETFCNTRTRHSIEFDLAAGVDKDGRLLAKDMHSYSNQGAYASHGHAIAANGLTSWRLQYACPNILGEKLIQSILIRRLVEPCGGYRNPAGMILLLKVLWRCGK